MYTGLKPYIYSSDDTPKTSDIDLRFPSISTSSGLNLFHITNVAHFCAYLAGILSLLFLYKPDVTYLFVSFEGCLFSSGPYTT